MKKIWQSAKQYFPILPVFLVCSLVLIHPGWAAEQAGALLVLDGRVMQQQNNGRMWQMDRSRKFKTTAEVQQYLRHLNQGPFKDWRLPSKWELLDLLTFFDLKRNGEVTIPLEGFYWLDEGKGPMYPGIWDPGDQCGVERVFYKGKSGHVRAVRP